MMVRDIHIIGRWPFFMAENFSGGEKLGVFKKLHLYGVNLHKMVSTQTWIWVILGDFFSDFAKFKTTIKSAGESPRKLHRPPQRVARIIPGRTDTWSITLVIVFVPFQDQVVFWTPFHSWPNFLNGWKKWGGQNPNCPNYSDPGMDGLQAEGFQTPKMMRQ